jgi:hypothetical protein
MVVMLIPVGLELNNEGRALAWALDFPGCFADGADGPEAVIALAHQLVVYEDWVNRHAGQDVLQLGDYDLRIVDTWQVYEINDRYEIVEGGYAVNAWFKQDWKPLESSEVERGIELLRWSREDLLRAVQPLRDSQLDHLFSGERWTIRGIVRHVANAEWWYLDRLGLVQGGRDELSKDVEERLSQVRQQLLLALPALVGQERVIGKEGEFWSPRKLLRRSLWHEINHRQHILNLLAQ